MTAMSLGVGVMEPDDIEGLLPWHATGTLNPRDARRVDEALKRDPELAKQYAVIQDEIAETIHVNESLGAPSSRAMQKLFAGIEAEPMRAARRPSNVIARIADIIVSLSPRTLAYSAAIGAVALVLQAGVIGAILTKALPGGYEVASAPAQAVRGTPVLVRFQPDAKMSDITQLLGSYGASIVTGPKAGMFRVQVGDRMLATSDADALVKKLQAERMISFAELAQ
jgi:anti-sigma factor RsiW